MTLDDLMTRPPFSIPQKEKERVLLPLLKELTEYHRSACAPYRKITGLAFPDAERATVAAELPYLPISLFKFRHLRSIAEKDVRATVTSSGTASAQKSRIDLDSAMAKLSSKALNLIIGSVIGEHRLPMLIIDCEAAIKSEDGMGARAAAILGLMPFGRDHCFALRDDLSVDEDKISAFLKTHAGKDIFIYGFTFLIWQQFIGICEKKGYDFSRAILLHSGGWKKLKDIAVGNEAFKSRLESAAGINKVANFYGMAELPGTIFLEKEDGLLYPPHFADVIIRDPVTFKPLPQGQPGLIQIISLLPHSYPGHSLLTEDMGVIEATDSSTCCGHGLHILGRAPRAELRGCSDVLMQEAA